MHQIGRGPPGAVAGYSSAAAFRRRMRRAQGDDSMSCWTVCAGVLAAGVLTVVAIWVVAGLAVGISSSRGESDGDADAVQRKLRGAWGLGMRGGRDPAAIDATIADATVRLAWSPPEAAAGLAEGLSAQLRAAGLPNDATFRVRDSIVAALLDGDVVSLGTALRVAAARQGTRRVAETGEEPGKILNQYPAVTVPGRDGLSTEFAATDATLLFLIGVWRTAVAESLASSGPPKALAQTPSAIEFRNAVRAAAQYVASHKGNDDLFWETPTASGASTFALQTTYWKDAGLAKGVPHGGVAAPPLREPAYPVVYSLVQAQAACALRCAAALLQDDQLAAAAQRMVAALGSLWDDQAGAFVTARDAEGDVHGPSADSLHLLFYLNAGDMPTGVPSDWMQKIEGATEVLRTRLGYMTSPESGVVRHGDEPNGDAGEVLFEGTVWPFEQAIIHAAAQRFQLQRAMEITQRMSAIRHGFGGGAMGEGKEPLPYFPEYLFRVRDVTPQSPPVAAAGHRVIPVGDDFVRCNAPQLCDSPCSLDALCVSPQFVSAGSTLRLATVAAAHFFQQNEKPRVSGDHVRIARSLDWGAEVASELSTGVAAATPSNAANQRAAAWQTDNTPGGAAPLSNPPHNPFSDAAVLRAPDQSRAVDASEAWEARRAELCSPRPRGALPLKAYDVCCDASALLPGSSAPTITCADGSATISCSLVNDNYCDCADGTDEPGTSACGDGMFICADGRGHPVPSSYVHDGVCDCCDGSDEWPLDGVPPPTSTLCGVFGVKVQC